MYLIKFDLSSSYNSPARSLYGPSTAMISKWQHIMYQLLQGQEIRTQHPTLGVVMKRGKNQVVHIYPDSAPPVRQVVLCIMFHIHSATQQERYFRNLII